MPTTLQHSNLPSSVGVFVSHYMQVFHWFHQVSFSLAVREKKTRTDWSKGRQQICHKVRRTEQGVQSIRLLFILGQICQQGWPWSLEVCAVAGGPYLSDRLVIWWERKRTQHTMMHRFLSAKTCTAIWAILQHDITRPNSALCRTAPFFSFHCYSPLCSPEVNSTFTFKGFSRRFYPKHLQLQYIGQKKVKQYIAVGNEDDHRTHNH